MTTRLRRLVAASLVASTLSTTACYDWTLVKPAQLGQLGPLAPGESSPPPAVDVERLDGTLARIHGHFDVRVTMLDGREITFEHPVRVTRSGNAYTFRAGNQPETTLDIDAIRSAQISQFSTGTTIGAAATAVGVLVLVTVVVLVGTSGSH
jgi:hypothetical protein